MEDQARKLSHAQTIIQRIDLNHPEVTTLVHMVLRALQSSSGILAEWDRFYPVVYGHHVGIYLHW
jgi:hypothetical protein